MKIIQLLFIVAILTTITACGGSDDTTTSQPEIKPDLYQLTIIPNSQQLKAITINTAENIDLGAYVNSEGLTNVQLQPKITVKQGLGSAKLECVYAKAHNLDIDLELSSTGVCILQYIVEGQTEQGKTVTAQGEVTVVASTKPSFTTLPPLSLLTVKPQPTDNYVFALAANPPTMVRNGTNNDQNNDHFDSGNYEYPADYTLADDVVITGQGSVAVDEEQNLTFTPASHQTAYTQITYLLENQTKTEAKLGFIYISVADDANHAPQADDFCVSHPTLTQGSSVSIDVRDYISDLDHPEYPDALTLLQANSMTGNIKKINKHTFTFIPKSNAYNHYINYMVSDDNAGFDVGQIYLTKGQCASNTIPVSTISAGNFFGYVLNEAGTLFVTGSDISGQLGNGNVSMSTNSWDKIDNIIDEGQPVDFIASSASQSEYGRGHGYLIDKKGNIWVSGSNLNGQLGLNLDTTITAWTKISKCGAGDCPRFTQVSTGNIHGYALDHDGFIWVTGDNSRGQLGLGTNDNKEVIWRKIKQCAAIDPDPIDCPKFKQISAGTYFGYALDSDGYLWVTGSDTQGNLGLGNQDYHDQTPIKIWTKVTQYVTTDKTEVTVVDQAPQFSQISAGGYNASDMYGLGIDLTGNIWAVGNNGAFGKLGLGVTNYGDVAKSNVPYWIQVTGKPLPSSTDEESLPPYNSDEKIVFMEISTGNEHSYALDHTGQVWAVGRDIEGQLGDDNDENKTRWIKSGIDGVSQLSAGSNFGYAIKDKQLWVVGAHSAHIGLSGLGLGAGSNVTQWTKALDLTPPQ